MTLIFLSPAGTAGGTARAAKLEKERFLEAEEDQTIQQTQELISPRPGRLPDASMGSRSASSDKIIVEQRLRFRWPTA
ncbi:MAG: hypothetical protein ACLS63_09380 [Flavonifractor plautii]